MGSDGSVPTADKGRGVFLIPIHVACTDAPRFFLIHLEYTMRYHVSEYTLLCF